MEYLLKIPDYNIVSNNHYNFLDIFKDYIDHKEIYYYINSYHDHQLINLYNFIKIRLYILNNLVDLNVPQLNSLSKIDYTIFNDQLYHIINENIYIAIFIINSILIYDKPK